MTTPDHQERLDALRNLEGSLLGRMLIPHEFYKVWSEANTIGLNAEDFYFKEHRNLYGELDRLRLKLGKPTASGPVMLDGATVFEWLISRGTADLCGGLRYVDDLSTEAPGRGPTGAVRHTLITIKDHAARRAALRTLSEARSKIEDSRQPLEESLVSASKALAQVAPADTSTKTKTLGQVGSAQLRTINKPPKRRRMSTGIPVVDWVMNGGLVPRRFGLLAARPGHGKTAFALNLLLNVAKQGAPVFFLSLEMKATHEEHDEETDKAEEHVADLGTRLTSIMSDVPIDAINALSEPDQPYPEDRDPDQDYEAVSRASLEMGQLPFEIEDDPSLTWPQVEARIRRAKARNPDLFMVCLDYIGLIKKERGQTAQDVLNEAADGLAALANELGLFVLALAQLNRDCEGKADRRPEPSNLRNSGKLEQAAGHILFVQRPCKYEPWSDYEDVFWVAEAKGRHGKKRDVCIQFEAGTQRVFGPAVPDPVRASFGTTGQIEDDDQGVGGGW